MKKKLLTSEDVDVMDFFFFNCCNEKEWNKSHSTLHQISLSSIERPGSNFYLVPVVVGHIRCNGSNKKP